MSSPIDGSFPPAYIPPSYQTGSLAATSQTSQDSIAGFDEGLSLSEFFQTSTDAHLHFSKTLHDIEFTDSKLFERFMRDALGQIDHMFQKFNELFNKFWSSQVNTVQTDPGTTSVNNTANAANPDISSVQVAAGNLNTETDTYNSEATNFNNAYHAGWATTIDRDADITAYNLAVDNYNNSATAYNNAVNIANSSITNYNAEVTNYNTTTLVTTNNQIDFENLSRPPLPPLPHQDPLPLYPLLATVPLQSHLPYADPVADVPMASQVTAPTLISILQLPSTLSFSQNFLNTQYVPFAGPALAYLTSFKRLFELTQKNKIQPNPGTQSITRPDAFIERKETMNVPNEGGASVGHGSLALGLDVSEQTSIVGAGLVEQYFKTFNVLKTAPLLEKLMPLVLTSFIRSTMVGALPGITTFLGADVSQMDENSPASRISMSIGSFSAVLGLLKSNALDEPLSTLLNGSTQLDSLSEKDKADLLSGLKAIASTALLKLGLGSLVSETQTPGLLKTIDGALLLGTPENANNRFDAVKTSMDSLKSSFGASQVSELLGYHLNDQLASDRSVPRSQAPVLAQNIATALTSGPTPENPDAQKALIQNEINNVLGPGANPNLAQLLSDQASLFALAGQSRSELLNNLVPQVGPAHAENLTDNTIVRLFGFSPSFTDGQVVERPKDESGALSAVNSLANDAKTLNKREDKEFAQTIKDSYNNTHEDIHNLGAFLRELIDPGQILVGLMYQGAQGSHFERGQTDIKVA